MLDLQKYEKRAAADPGFKARLLENANQAIKDEFGEDLPYALKCKEKLSFEVEPMDGSNDVNFEGVAGGTPPGFGRQTIPPGYVRFDPRDFPVNATLGPNYISYKDASGNLHTLGIKVIEGVRYVKTGSLNDQALEGVSGGTTVNLIPLEVWKEGIEAAGYTLSTTLKKDDWGSHKYYDYDNYGNRRSKSVKLVKVDGEWYAVVE